MHLIAINSKHPGNFESSLSIIYIQRSALTILKRYVLESTPSHFDSTHPGNLSMILYTLLAGNESGLMLRMGRNEFSCWIK